MKITDTCTCGSSFGVEDESMVCATDAYEYWWWKHTKCRERARFNFAPMPSGKDADIPGPAGEDMTDDRDGECVRCTDCANKGSCEFASNVVSPCTSFRQQETT